MIDLYKAVKGDEPLKLIPPPEEAVNARGETVPGVVEESFKKSTNADNTFELVDESTIMGNLFYLNTEKPEKVNIQNNVAHMVHKAMHYTCVDGNGPTKKI